MGDIGVPAFLFCHRQEKIDLKPPRRGRGGGHLYILIGSTEAPSLVTVDILCALEVSCVVETQAFP